MLIEGLSEEHGCARHVPFVMKMFANTCKSLNESTSFDNNSLFLER